MHFHRSGQPLAFARPCENAAGPSPAGARTATLQPKGAAVIRFTVSTLDWILGSALILGPPLACLVLAGRAAALAGAARCWSALGALLAFALIFAVFAAPLLLHTGGVAAAWALPLGAGALVCWAAAIRLDRLRIWDGFALAIPLAVGAIFALLDRSGGS